MLDQLINEINLMIRSRYPLIYVVSWEEQRFLESMETLVEQTDKRLFTWSLSQGLRRGEERCAAAHQPHEMLSFIRSCAERSIFVIQDFHPHIDDPSIRRMLKELSYDIVKELKTIIFLSPVVKVPKELEKDIVVVDMPLPSEDELLKLLRNTLRPLQGNTRVAVELSEDLEEKVVQAAKGLTLREAERVFAKCIIENYRFCQEDVKIVVEEKRQLIRKTELFEYYHLTEGMGNVGGLNNLKKWFEHRCEAFGQKARDYHLPAPKGALLLGIQGCGKSLAAKAVASLWQVPLLRLDVGSIFSSYIGQSEANMKRAMNLASTLAPCVLWLDEIEKGFAGLKEGGNDGGTTKRVLGTFLTWMQEKTAAVFVIATANSIQFLPPELLRKGRFDEIFFIDLPDAEERHAIFKIHIEKRKRSIAKFDIKKLVELSEGFSGAEIEQVIISAMYTAFAEKREFSTKDIVKELKESVPLSITMKEDIADLRTWAKTRARSAK